MKTRLLLFLCLTGNVFTKKPPDVDCTVVHLKYVECLWKTPDVNYSFSSGFHDPSFLRECDSYIIKDGLNVGCKQPEDELRTKRFNSFYTRLVWGEQNHTQQHQLRHKVKLYPPTNVTVEFRSDSNLWFEWRQIFTNCVQSRVRYKVNDNKWEESLVRTGQQSYCINLPSKSFRYELQVQSRVASTCGQSEEWSDWSQPAIWGTHNDTDQVLAPPQDSLRMWSVVMYCVGGAGATLLLLLMLLHHERIRIILIPVVPKPSLVPDDLQKWFDSSKGMKEVFQNNYLERTCSVREYCPIPSSESLNSSKSSINTDQTNPNSDPNDSRSSSSSEISQPEEQHISI